MIAKLVIDPRDPNIVYAASMGHVFKPNAERGIFKTTDGGETWQKVLFVDENTGGIDLVMDARNPNVLYAAMWQAQRQPWKLTSGGPGSGLYKTLDGGAHWTKISKNPGFATGILGKIGVSVAASNPRVVYAIVQARDGGVFRSNDAGATWKRVNAEMEAASARVLLHGDLRRPDQSGGRVRAGSRWRVQNERRRKDLDGDRNAARRQSHRLDQSA